MHVLVALAKGLGCLDVNTLKSEIQHLKAPKTCFLHQLFRWQVTGSDMNTKFEEFWLFYVRHVCICVLCIVYLLSHWCEEDGLFARPATDLHCFMPLYNDKSLGIGQLGVQFGNNRINV